ncbi:MAG: hypothetical protein ACM3JD_13600 [Rudaea sp.]
MSRWIAAAALAVALISLALNVLLIGRLNQARVGALATLDRASARIGDLRDVEFAQTVRIDEDLPVAGSLPFHQDLVVPIHTTIPISMTLHASVNTPFGPIDVPVPLNTTFPVDLTVPVTIDRTIPYSFTVPVNMAVPIRIRARDLGVEPAIQEAQNEILRLRRSLE